MRAIGRAPLAVSLAVALTGGGPARAQPSANAATAALGRETGAAFEEARLGGEATRDVLISHEIEALIQQKEHQVTERRQAAIALLESFLAGHPHAPEEAEVLFQLAEMRWEEAKAGFLVGMAAYQAAVERCATKEAESAPAEKAVKSSRAGKSKAAKSAPHCRDLPPPPALHLESSQAIYRRLLAEYPGFRKTDAVHYLYGYSLRDQGRPDEALVQFRKIIDEHPGSHFLPDAWMAVAEARFYQDGDYKGALAGYLEVQKYPDSPLADLALFKTAWCLWKMGDPEAAARRFKEVLDLGGKGHEKSHHAGKEGQKRLRELQSEALDYLVQIFTEDEHKGPKEAYDFLASIGGAQYSRRVLDKLGEVFAAQARYERAVETERFLIELDPSGLDCPEHQERIIAAYRAMDEGPQALAEMRRLVEEYGPKSGWATKNQAHPTEVAAAAAAGSRLLREVARELHAAAQAHEKAQKGHADVERYARAAEAYGYYLEHFPDEAESVEIRYLLGDIEFFKRGRYEAAGDAYLAVGKSQPVGKLHHEALLNAITAYEKVREAAVKKDASVARTPLASDKKMGEAIDRYAELFPADKEIGNLLYKNGELFYAYGEYDEAVKRFGLIVEKYPHDAAAAAAGDKILDSLNKAKDYANVESWARRLLKVPAFKSAADQDRLAKLVIDAGFKSGEQLAEKQPIEAAATFRRVAKEFPLSARAPLALYDAGLLLAQNARPEEAIAVDEELVQRYPQAKEAPQAAWAAAKLYEQAALWEQAARDYEALADRYKGDPHAADALYNAGLLREHLGDPKGAIGRYGEYAKRYRDRDDAGDVAFRVGVVLDGSGRKAEAAQAFLDYAARYKGPRAVEALARAGQALLDTNPGAANERKAAEALQRAVRMAKQAPSKAASRAAAHALYLLGEIAFREYERIQFDADPKKLRGALERKSRKLEEARAVYLEAVALGDPEWATAALYRVGDAYERFAKAMRTAPVPKELKEAEQQVYREELEKVVVVVEEKALDAYRGGYQKALQLGIYNEFTQKLRQALGRLNDQEFPPENELRAGHAPAEAPRPPPLVEEVSR
jgi:TolA-binding protein